MSDLIKRVASEIRDTGVNFSTLDMAVTAEEVAEAAITEIFNWLAEPSDRLVTDLMCALLNSGLNVNLASDAENAWKAMLEQARKEALGE